MPAAHDQDNLNNRSEEYAAENLLTRRFSISKKSEVRSASEKLQSFDSLLAAPSLARQASAVCRRTSTGQACANDP